jgi:hypothetical protein
MNIAQRIDFDALMEPVALRLLGEPVQKHGNEWRYRGRGSLAIDLKKGTWFDHEANEGGGVFDLIRRQGHEQPAAWLRSEGLLGAPQVVSQHVVSQPRIVAAYNYPDENGEVLFQVVRLEPKDFRQRRPDGRGGWIWNLQDTRRVLYRVPELEQAVAAGETIYVPEGEKDVDNLRALGVAATTNPGGVKKWRQQYAEHLRGADVVVVSDSDDAGREHSELIAASLCGIAKRIRILDIGKHWPVCPAKGDITDWLAAGGTVEKLKAIVEALPEVTAHNLSSSSTLDQSSNPSEPAWPTMAENAYYGLAGDVVKAIEPYTEADPVAVLIQFLACAGNIIGNCAYYQVEGSRHHANLFSVLVGESSKARKGTSWDRISDIVRIADERWHSERAKGGLSSGEGLINEVRDESKKWNPKDGSWETVDPGVVDKRLMVTEPEFAGVLAVVERHGNTLSSLIRKAWDAGILSTMTRSSPLRATGAHISIVGHITVEELRARLTRTDTANGFANRFLFTLVKRSKVLPFGGSELEDKVIADLGERLKKAIEVAAPIGRVGWTTPAADAWKAVYAQLSQGQPGLLGAVTSRAEAQCVRLALIYALLDGKANIELPHINAALAVWEYAEVSAAHIFGASLGDNVADDILRALQSSREGMSRTAIRDLFGRHQSADRIGAALALLASKGRARPETKESGGRPMEVWTATEAHRHG